MVANHPANRRLQENLESRGEAEQFEIASGTHRLSDYATPECLAELIRFAGSIAPPR
jgi:hypothetical protein